MKQSGMLLRKDEENEEYNLKVQAIWKQFMIDTLQITINEEDGYGFDRISRLTRAWEANIQEFFPAIDPRDPLSDVKQEHMQRAFERICKDKGEVIPFYERYPWLKRVRYDKKLHVHKKKRR